MCAPAQRPVDEGHESTQAGWPGRQVGREVRTGGDTVRPLTREAVLQCRIRSGQAQGQKRQREIGQNAKGSAEGGRGHGRVSTGHRCLA